MADQPVSYSLVSWLRSGLASLVTGQPATNYAALPVSISVNGTAVNAPAIRLLGPGDITGLDARAVIRTEPLNLTDNFEPNYLAVAELALPDLPWMFTPSGDVGGRLQPWICLIVVPDAPGATIESRAGGVNVLQLDAPLNPVAELPDLKTIDLWAHAQVTGAALQGADLQNAFQGDPSATLSRLISSRQLEPGKRYIACIVPTYHAGVNAALGLPVDDHDLALAWDASVSAPFTLPVYYYFRFSTGPGGDFASLAEKIQPAVKPLDIGTRTMDVSSPDFGLPPLLGLTMELEGALRKISTPSTGAQAPSAAQSAYAKSLPNALVPPVVAGADPIVAPPTYGSAQAGVPFTATGNPLWLRSLNLDPRMRVAASAGTQVVADNQEALVAAAWDQVGALSTANSMYRRAQLARQVTASLNDRHLKTVVAEGDFLQMTAPVHSRVSISGGNMTLRANIASSRVPLSAVGGGLRKLTRPGGSIGKQMTGGALHIVEGLNSTLQAAAPLQPLRGMIAFDDVGPKSPNPAAVAGVRIAQMTAVQGAAGWKLTAVTAQRASTLNSTRAVLAVSRLATASPSPTASPVPVPPAAPVEAKQFVDWSANANLPEVLKADRANVPAAFAIAASQSSVVHDQFAAASLAANKPLQVSVAAPAPPPPLGIGAPSLTTVRAQLQTRLDPEKTIPSRFGARIPLGTGADSLQPVRTGPQFPTPMYAALADLSPDWMLPGISSVPLDCATLLAPNPEFIESFMIGLNEGLSRELLWRQYPADLRSTYFQCFWTSGISDIPQISAFDGSRDIGAHVLGASTGAGVVLLIRANLFRRYPNAIVSAIPAKWVVPGQSRVLDPAQPRIFPSFRGEIGADVTFLGFPIADPRGSGGNPGYYFVIEEHLTEPRFGLEPTRPAMPSAPPVWNDLSWQDVPSGTFLTPAWTSTSPSTAEQVTWASNSASMAYILMRKPVRVAMHAIALMGAA